MKAFIFVSLVATQLWAFSLEPKPTQPGRDGDAVNCEKPGSDGWADCWCWNYLNKDWEQCEVDCKAVDCGRKSKSLSEILN